MKHHKQHKLRAQRGWAEGGRHGRCPAAIWFKKQSWNNEDVWLFQFNFLDTVCAVLCFSTRQTSQGYTDNKTQRNKNRRQLKNEKAWSMKTQTRRTFQQRSDRQLVQKWQAPQKHHLCHLQETRSQSQAVIRDLIWNKNIYECGHCLCSLYCWITAGSIWILKIIQQLSTYINGRCHCRQLYVCGLPLLLCSFPPKQQLVREETSK